MLSAAVFLVLKAEKNPQHHMVWGPSSGRASSLVLLF